MSYLISVSVVVFGPQQELDEFRKIPVDGYDVSEGDYVVNQNTHFYSYHYHASHIPGPEPFETFSRQFPNLTFEMESYCPDIEHLASGGFHSGEKTDYKNLSRAEYIEWRGDAFGKDDEDYIALMKGG